MIDIEILRTLLRYEPETGKLFWLPRPVETFASNRAATIWNKRYAGAEAFTFTSPAGYKQGRVNYRAVQAHRVIWAMTSGAWPLHEIDHINGDPGDNRLSNLRAATRSENGRNVRKHRDATSRFRGVSWSSRDKRWVAHICTDGKVKSLGNYVSEIEAAEVYDRAAAAAHGEYAKLNFATSPTHQ